MGTSVLLPPVLILLTLSGAASEPSGNEGRLLPKAATIVAQGSRALESGNSRKAERHYTKALGLLPDLPEAHLGKGHVRMQRKDFTEALASFREAERCYRAETASLLDYRRQRYHRARARLTEIARRVLMMEANIEILEAVVTESSGDSTARQRDKLRTLQQDVASQKSEARRLEGIPPPEETDDEGVPGEVYFFVGNALRNLDRLDEAIAAWELCTTSNPSFAPAHYNLAVAYWRLGRREAAVTSLQKAEALGFRVLPGFKAELFP